MARRTSAWLASSSALLLVVIAGCGTQVSLSERPSNAQEREAVARAVARAGNCGNAEMIDDDGETARLDCNRLDGTSSAYITVSANQDVLSKESDRVPRAQRPWLRAPYWLVTGPDAPQLAPEDTLEEFAAAVAEATS